MYFVFKKGNPQLFSSKDPERIKKYLDDEGIEHTLILHGEIVSLDDPSLLQYSQGGNKR